jgi:hypothetical protein
MGKQDRQIIGDLLLEIYNEGAEKGWKECEFYNQDKK